MGRVVADVEHDRSSPSEKRLTGRTGEQGRKLQSFKRVGLGQNMRGVGILAMVRPVYRVLALLATVDQNGAVADLADNARLRRAG
jgi:hypothetical protein